MIAWDILKCALFGSSLRAGGGGAGQGAAAGGQGQGQRLAVQIAKSLNCWG